MQNSNNINKDFLSQNDEESDMQFADDVVEYSNQVANIISELREKEDELKRRTPVTELYNTPFYQVLDEYSRHEKFISEICDFCHTIMKCREEGQEMRDNIDLYSEKDRDEIGIHVDSIEACYERLKIHATDRLRNLQRILEERQQTKIERFEEWLTHMESRIAMSSNIGPDLEAIEKQKKDLSSLRVELEQKQDFLNFMSNVIIFDDVESESLQIRSRSCTSLDDRLEKMNRRWIEICGYVEERDKRLKDAETIWRLLNLEGAQLFSWFRKVDKNLEELSNASQSASELQPDDVFIQKLITRSDRIDSEIKSKQSFYTSLETRVRMEIVNFDDPCSMFVIELEKKLEDMRDFWNGLLNRKRMLDYSLQALAKKLEDDLDKKPKLPRTGTSQNHMHLNDTIQSVGTFNSPDTNLDLSPSNETFSEHLNHSSSSGNDEKDSSLHNDASMSDRRAFDNSLSSDTRSILNGSNHDRIPYDNNDSQDELSSTSMTASYPINPTMISSSDTGKDMIQSAMTDTRMKDDSKWLLKHVQDSEQSGTQSCRVEEWKHSLESFSTWLKQVETSLGIDIGLEAIVGSESSVSNKSWMRLDAFRRLLLLIDIQKQIVTTCQDEFDCLILQGQQIIEDLVPEIGENEYEADLKQILTDLEMRYSAIKRTLDQRKQELADKDHWFRLLKTSKDLCDYLINQMSLVIAESSIGVDLITLAQQQDELIRAKADLEENTIIQSNIQESEIFLKLCDTLQQQSTALTQESISLDRLILDQKQYQKQQKCNQMLLSLVDDIWFSLKPLREDIQSQLDRLTIHSSELTHLIEDRLARLEEVYKEMHSLQHKMQELAAKLQVAEILKSNWVQLENLTIERLSEQLEDLKLYRERLGEVESIHKVMNAIFDWMTESDVPLSHQNLNRINELNTIWDMIQESVEERQRQIEQAFDNQSASEQKFLEQTVSDLPSWERRVATSKIPYFVDHKTNKTHWDHPKFDDLLKTMSCVNQIVFAAYRTALKLRMVQKRLGIDLLMLEQLKELVDFSLNSGDLPETSGSNDKNSKQTKQPIGNSFANNDELVGVEQVIVVLKAIYQKIKCDEKSSLDVPLSIDLTLNWLLNLYDS